MSNQTWAIVLLVILDLVLSIAFLAKSYRLRQAPGKKAHPSPAPIPTCSVCRAGLVDEYVVSWLHGNLCVECWSSGVVPGLPFGVGSESRRRVVLDQLSQRATISPDDSFNERLTETLVPRPLTPEQMASIRARFDELNRVAS